MFCLVYLKVKDNYSPIIGNKDKNQKQQNSNKCEGMRDRKFIFFNTLTGDVSLFRTSTPLFFSFFFV